MCCRRINKVTFKFTLFTFFRDDIIEDETSVHAIFHVHIILVNNLHSSMIVNIDLDSKLTRYCSDFRKGTTIGDMVIIILLILSSFTYINSFINTYKLSKVHNYYIKSQFNNIWVSILLKLRTANNLAAIIIIIINTYLIHCNKTVFVIWLHY